MKLTCCGHSKDRHIQIAPGDVICLTGFCRCGKAKLIETVHKDAKMNKNPGPIGGLAGNITAPIPETRHRQTAARTGSASGLPV